MTKPKVRNGGSLRRWAERILLIAGVAGLGAWCGQKAVSTVWEAWANHVFDEESHEAQTAVTLPGDEPPAGKPSRVKPSPAKPTEGGAVIGRLAIPRLNLSAMVREGVGEGTLSLALGHIPNTALPGQPGNVAIAGHRDTTFRSLREIQKYDLIRLETTTSGSFLYQVSSIEVVDPANVSVLRASQKPELTLVTCFPFNYIGAAPRRFIVKAREVGLALHSSEKRQISFRRPGEK